MTKDKDFKAAVRARMRATGQPYTAARADLEASSPPTPTATTTAATTTAAAAGLPADARIFVSGHRGLVGGALVRRLRALGHDNLLLVATRDQLDLRDQAAVNCWFRANRPPATATWSPCSCGAFTRPASPATTGWPCGGPARRGASCSTWTTWPTPASS